MVVLICHSLFSNLLETNAISHYDTCVQVYIKITFRLKYLPLDGIFHIFGRPKRCEGSTKCSPTSLRHFHTYEIKRKNPEYQHFTTFYQHPWDIFHIYEIWINSWIPAFHPTIIYADILPTGSVNPRPKIMFSDKKTKNTKKTKRKKWEKRQLWKKNEALSCCRVKISARQGLVPVHSCTI